jgi:hypothetical protein
MTRIFVAGLITSVAFLTAPVAASAEAAITKGATTNTAANVDAESKAAPAPAVEEKKICKQLPSSSSRLPNRACLTRKQWQQVEQESR